VFAEDVLQFAKCGGEMRVLGGGGMVGVAPGDALQKPHGRRVDVR
jgi:hypothetical protein